MGYLLLKRAHVFAHLQHRCKGGEISRCENKRSSDEISLASKEEKKKNLKRRTSTEQTLNSKEEWRPRNRLSRNRFDLGIFQPGKLQQDAGSRGSTSKEGCYRDFGEIPNVSASKTPPPPPRLNESPALNRKLCFFESRS